MLDTNELLDHDIQQNLININYNLNIVYDLESIKGEYIYLYKRIKNRINYLNNFLEYAKEKCQNPLYDKQSDTYKIIFYGAVTYLSTRYGGHYATWDKNINLLVALGLIEKVNIEEINCEYIQVVNSYQRQKKARSLKIDSNKIKPISYYSLPLFSADILTKANENAKLLYDNNFRMNAMSKIALLKIDENIANRVFPDERKVTEFSDYVMMQIQKYILRSIKYRGYATKYEVINNTHINLKHIKSEEYGLIRGSVTQILSREFDRNINTIIKTNSLLYKRANKKLKEKFMLKSYKTIICKDY